MVKAVLCILASVLFAFEVFDVFKNIQRSFSSDFCFLVLGLCFDMGAELQDLWRKAA